MSIPVQRTVLLHGTHENGNKQIKNIKHPGVIIADDCNSPELTAIQHSTSSGNKKISSILIVTTPDDDISTISGFHDLAGKLNILVTTIIFSPSSREMMQNSEYVSNLRKNSDMIIITSDINYMHYMLECIT